MDAIGLNPIKLDAIGLDPVRMNAIRLGVPGASSGSGRPYIDPELLSHVKMAISTWGKTNDDPDRAILKDLTPNGNDMRLLNFGFAGDSGYGLYHTNFSDWNKPSVSDFIKYLTNNSFHVINSDSSATKRVIYQNTSSSTPDIKGFKIKVEIIKGGGYYRYFDNTGRLRFFPIQESGIYELPTSYNSAMSGEDFIGFTINTNSEYKLEQLPDFEGWLCTDGVDDIIESVKPISEVLEGSNEITVVSIIHGIGSKNAYTNVLRESGSNYIRNTSTADGKTGIYGYTCKDTTKSIITDILGDKNDYKLEYIQTTTPSTVNSVFSVAGWRENNGSMIVYPVAYAGGFIANKVLTTDEINQIIAYFNLDRPGQIIKPQLYCNIKKQGITNDNHAEFNDQLIDFVGGHNIQLNNIGWEGESGIGSYPVVLGINKTFRFGTQWEVSNSGAKMSCVDIVDISLYSLYYNVKNPEGGVITTEIPSFTIKVSGITDGSFGYLRYGYLAAPDAVAITEFRMTADGTYTLPKCYGGSEALDKSKSCYVGFSVEKTNVPGSLIIEVLPTIEHALSLDGINDFGKVTGLPVLKDYTVVADYERIRINIGSNGDAAVLSKAESQNNGAFMFNTISNNGEKISYSFGGRNIINTDDTIRRVFYQSKYINNGQYINIIPTFVDSDKLWLGTYRDNDTRFAKLALWSLMLFPYSLSEFLLERQLKKYKAGTLYPDMIEFRPVIKSNVPYSSISYSVNPGEYIAEGSTVTITITLSNASDKLVGVSSNAIADISISGDSGTYEITGKVTKSPQKISIVISSYLTMLGNDTLISNETLIKNE